MNGQSLSYPNAQQQYGGYGPPIPMQGMPMPQQGGGPPPGAPYPPYDNQYPPNYGPGPGMAPGPGYPPGGPGYGQYGPPDQQYGQYGNEQYGGYGPPGQYGPGGPPGQYGPGGPPGQYGPGAPPIMNQPGPNGGWMQIPQAIPNCPPGLEYLTMIDQLLVKQKVELLEAFTGFETNNKFTVKNSHGQKVYHAIEDNDCCTRNCCGPMRPFDMKILDNYQNEVIHLNRPLACDSCCFPCCLQSMEVSAPPGNVIGTIEQEWSIFCPKFSIKNAQGDVVLRIDGPFCTFSFCGDVEFQVLAAHSDTVVGRISKQWSGLAREMFTDADFFGVTFPMDLDVRMKAVMLGATFLIDAMFFEKSGNREQDRPGMF